ncbi:MAG: YybH family protein [Terriglobia bacterium]
MNKLFLVFATLLAVAATACAPRVDVAAERAAIRAADGEYMKAVQAKDADSFVSFYTEDAAMLPPNGARKDGKQAIRKFASEVLEDPNFAVNWVVNAVEVSAGGDWAYTLSAIEITTSDPEGNPVTEKGKDVHLWKKQADGTWKIAVDIWNSDQPAAPATQ